MQDKKLKLLDDTVLKVLVKGEYALFTQPDLKTERVSYRCMTISAARGILDSILWKKEFKWWIHRIKILNPVKFVTMKRNEINSKANFLKGRYYTPIYVDGVDKRGSPINRCQRNNMLLKDVAYIIEASIAVDENFKDKEGRTPYEMYAKYKAMFQQRLSKGQCFRRPYLGIREYACEIYEATGKEKPIEESFPIGSMFYDFVYDENGEIIRRLFDHEVMVYNGVLEANVLNNMELLASYHIPTGERKESKGQAEAVDA